MSFNNIKWERDLTFSSGVRNWNSSLSGYKIWRNASYREYTSPEFLVKLIQELLSLSGDCGISATYTKSNILVENHVFNAAEVIEFGKIFDERCWGVWAIASGPSAPQTDDLIDLFRFVEPNGFAIFIDLDDGMVVACPNELVV